MNLTWLRALLPASKAPQPEPQRANEPAAAPRSMLQAGRQTTPSNALSLYGWSAIPRRAAHAVDLSRVDVRQYSAQQLLDILADISPEVSLALWNVLRLVGGEVVLTAMKPDKSGPDERAQGTLNTLLDQVELRQGGLAALVDQWVYTLYLQGAASAEVVLQGSLKAVDEVIAVQPYTIEFRRDEAGHAKPWCLDALGAYKQLNEALFWYTPLDSPPDDPYGRAPASPAIGEVMFGIQMLVDLKRAVHTNAWGRLDVSVLYEMLAKAAPKNVQSSDSALWAWINARLAEIKTQYDTLQPDDTFIHLDLVKVGGVDSSGKMLQIAPLIRVIELRTIRALKQMPILMGSNEGTTETHGTVQFEIFAEGIITLRAKIGWLIERVFTTALNVLGVQAAIAASWADLRTTDRLKDAQAEALEIANEANKVLNGWTDNTEAAQTITGHEPVSEELPARPQPAEQPNLSTTTSNNRLPGKQLNVTRRSVERDPDGSPHMTAAERAVLSALRADVAAHFRRMGRTIPADDLAQQFVDATAQRSVRITEKSDDDEYQLNLDAALQIIKDWFEGSAGREASADLRDILGEHYIATWNAAGQDALWQLGLEGSFNLTNEAVLENLRRFGAERVKGMDEFSKRRLAKVMADSLAEGNGVDGIAKAIRAEFTEWSKSRAKLVAHTEVGEQMSACSHETFTRNGVPRKSWLTVANGGDYKAMGVEIKCEENEKQGSIPMAQAFRSGHARPLAHVR